MMKKLSRNLTMLFDYYEITMANGYFRRGMKDQIAYFDVFYRSNPDKGGYAIAAGLEQVVEYINDLHFDEEDIAYLAGKGCFHEDFLDYLRHFKFTGDIWAVPEGTVIFPGEPIMTVRAPAIEAQFVETYILLCINHQSLIATKSNRIVRAAAGRPVSEFGSRRAQGASGAILGARAAYIAGCSSTACAIADELFGVPAGGTMAHSWIQMFDTEYEAFDTYCRIYPDNPTLLIDTYSVLSSGCPNAIKVFKKHNITKGGVRIDSGDIAYLTKKVRRQLNEAGLYDIRIIISNSMDEYIIRDILQQGAQIDAFGVGERLITSKSSPVFGGVYKLVAVEKDGEVVPKIKISENPQKITNPHFKKVYRLYENDSGKAIADLLCVHDEVINDKEPLTIFDPNYTWKTKTLTNYTAKELQVQIFKDGKCIYDRPSTQQIREYCKAQLDLQWDEVKRFENPHEYYVDLSQKLWDIKHDLLKNQNKK